MASYKREKFMLRRPNLKPHSVVDKVKKDNNN